MTKQKRGFLLFICSLLPGAGELYMGFKKMGLSLMALFFGTITCTSMLNIDALIFLLPIIWFYSFFNVHNLKNLSNEEFLTIEDDYIFHIESYVKDNKDFIKKYRNILAFLLIILGISGLWNSLTSWLCYLIPDQIYQYINSFGSQMPAIAISILLVIMGVKLISGKREELNENEIA